VSLCALCGKNAFDFAVSLFPKLHVVSKHTVVSPVCPRYHYVRFNKDKMTGRGVRAVGD